MKHLSFLIITLGLLFLFGSCVGNRLCPIVTIPTSDSSAPSVAFNIRGPGINQTFSISDGWPTGQLNVKANGVYSFILSVNDESGTRLVQMQIPGVRTLSISDLSPDAVDVREISPLSSIISSTNNEASPKSCIVISGKINMADDINVTNRLGLGAFDFNENTSSVELNIFTTDNDDELGFVLY